MLSSVLRSKAAMQVNIAIARTFVRLREILANQDLARKIKERDYEIAALFSAVEKLLAFPEPKRNPIGYIHPKD